MEHPTKAQLEEQKVLEILTNVRPSPTVSSNLTSQQKIEKISFHFTEIMKSLDLDLNDDSLRETPVRIAKMICFVH